MHDSGSTCLLVGVEGNVVERRNDVSGRILCCWKSESMAGGTLYVYSLKYLRNWRVLRAPRCSVLKAMLELGKNSHKT